MSRHFWFLIFLAACLFVWIAKAPLFSLYLTRMVGVSIFTSRISFWPSETVLRSFQIKNPSSGFRTKQALFAEEISLHYELKELLKNPSHIEEILLKKVRLTVEYANPLGTENNWTQISKNVLKDRGRKEILIKLFTIQDLTIEILGLGLDAKPSVHKIDQITFNNLSSEKGFPTELVIQKLFEDAGLDHYLKEAFSPEGIIDEVLSPI